jgi:PADR1 (NUC008) domain
MVTTRTKALKHSKLPPKSAEIPAHKSNHKKNQKETKKSEPKLQKVPVVKKDIEKKNKNNPPTKKTKPERVPVKKNPGSSYKGYTSGQYTQYLKLKNDFDKKTIPELKEICRKNGQKVTGTKPELIERVADGKLLGAIPKCPSCGGGRPKWDAKSATYKCPGYMEDSDFVNCHKKYSFAELPRTSWVD